MILSARRFFVTLTAATLLTQVVGLARADEQPTWSSSSTDHYRLFYRPEFEQDAQQVRRLLDAAITSLKKEFADFPMDELLRVDCAIYLHPKGTDKASESFASITTSVKDGGQYVAAIHLLAPSAYDPSYRSNVNEPPGDDHFSKLIMHEYSTILLERITRSKRAGWSFFSAPRWFTDGYEEYLGLMLSSPRNRTDVLAKYLARHKDSPGRIDFAFGIGVENDYIDGALLLLFMHEVFGKQQVHDLLRSQERRFGRAMAASLGVGLEEFERRWDEWLELKLG